MAIEFNNKEDEDEAHYDRLLTVAKEPYQKEFRRYGLQRLRIVED